MAYPKSSPTVPLMGYPQGLPTRNQVSSGQRNDTISNEPRSEIVRTISSSNATGAQLELDADNLASNDESMNDEGAEDELMEDEEMDGYDQEDELEGLSVFDLAADLLEQFEESGSIDDLNKGIKLMREGIEGLSVGSYTYLAAIEDLSSALARRFEESGVECDLKDAILLDREVLRFPTPSPWHRDRSAQHNQLADHLWIQFEQLGQQHDLDEVISSSKEALALQPAPHPDRASSLGILAGRCLTLFQQLGRQHDLDEAISLSRDALSLRPPHHPDRAISLTRLATSLATSFKQLGVRNDLEEAILLEREALKLLLPPHPLRLISLNNLANSLWTQFDQFGQQSDLDEAISLNREALRLRTLPDTDRSISLSSLANCLLSKFQQFGQQNDLEEAILSSREALELQPSPHPLRSTSLGELARGLEYRFELIFQPADLEESISLDRQALLLRPRPNPDRPISLNNLASGLQNRFQYMSQQSDFDEAVLLYREALEILSPTHPLHSTSLSNLASILSIRFQQLGQQSDLEEIVLLNRKALGLLPLSHPVRSLTINSLASSLLARFVHHGHEGDIEEAIFLNRKALELRPSSHPDRSMYLTNLASSLWVKFDKLGQETDLEESISLNKEALSLRPLPHPLRSVSLGNLASCLWVRFERHHQQIDLEESLSFSRAAVELQPAPHPLRSDSLGSLGDRLSRAHLVTEGKSDYLEQAVSAFSAAMQCSPRSSRQRLDIAKRWIVHATINQHESTLDAYSAAIQALHLLAAFSTDIRSRQEIIKAASDGLARYASACAILRGNFTKAIELLEVGRTVFWAHVLALRSPLDDLHIDSTSRELAKKMRALAIALENGSHRDMATEMFDNRKKLTIEQETAQLNRLNEEWVKSLDEVRNVEGFEDFLMPRTFSSLQAAASKNPVILLIANMTDSHCLVITATVVHHIHLPTLTPFKLQELVDLIQLGVSQYTPSRDATEEAPETANSVLAEERGMRYKVDKLRSSDAIFKSVLETIWNSVVKPVIDFLNIQRDSERKNTTIPILQWCPTGLFTFLPIHAAGLYDHGPDCKCASDYFVSSYTPTIGQLLLQPTNQISSTQPFQMMVIIQSKDLPSTKKELEVIEKYAPGNAIMKFGVPGSPATVEEVSSRLSQASIVHFACHGKQDQSDPLNSGLKLEDGLLQISRIMRKTIPHGSLAFLCACETVMGDEKVPDEAMSLGASLLFSGFRRVIGTMWEMKDEDGPTIVDAVYEEIFKGSDGKPILEPDTTKSAQALHLAVQKLRSKNVEFRRWVPFIHMGN